MIIVVWLTSTRHLLRQLLMLIFIQRVIRQQVTAVNLTQTLRFVLVLSQPTTIIANHTLPIENHTMLVDNHKDAHCQLTITHYQMTITPCQLTITLKLTYYISQFYSSTFARCIYRTVVE